MLPNKNQQGNVSEEGGSAPSDLYLIHDGALDLPSLSKLAPDRRVIGREWDQRDTPPAGARVLLYLPTEQLRELAPLAVERQWELGLLPHPEARQVTRACGVKGDVEDVFVHYLQAEAIEADVFTCNGQVVFSSVRDDNLPVFGS